MLSTNLSSRSGCNLLHCEQVKAVSQTLHAHPLADEMRRSHWHVETPASIVITLKVQTAGHLYQTAFDFMSGYSRHAG